MTGGLSKISFECECILLQKSMMLFLGKLPLEKLLDL